MKVLIAVTCLAILMTIGQHFWSAYQDDKFEQAIADILAREAADNGGTRGPRTAH